MACGTGAVAAFCALQTAGKLEKIVNVKLDGGDLKVCLDKKDGNVWIEGQAVSVFDGVIDL